MFGRRSTGSCVNDTSPKTSIVIANRNVEIG
jgi:hypothetical protein